MNTNSVTTSQSLLLPVLANNTVEETELKQQKVKLYYDKEQTLPHLQIHLPDVITELHFHRVATQCCDTQSDQKLITFTIVPHQSSPCLPNTGNTSVNTSVY